MSQNIREDILLNYLNVAILTSSLKVLVIGGGNSAYIKCKSLTDKGVKVTVVAKEFNEKFETLKGIHKITDSYKKKYLEKNHLIIIAIKKGYDLDKIIGDCEEEFKLYLNCSDFIKGKFILPIQDNTENVNFSLNIKGGNPKTSIFLKDKVKKELLKYDSLAQFNTALRNKIKASPFKKEIMAFTASDDFNFFLEKGVHEKILKLFYGGNSFEYKNSN